MSISVLSGNQYGILVRSGAASLKRNRQAVNDLNVFPVPDGDTGDNMFLTIDSGSQTASHLKDEPICDAAEMIARGMLMGARGNSGVILSRMFAGIAKGLSGLSSACVKDFAEALETGIGEAYSAVSVPVEGTILSVYRDAVRYANARLSGESCFENYFDDLISESHKSLLRTPDLLDVLREAGVVDSGGAGLELIVKGMREGLSGNVTFEDADESESGAPRKTVDFSLFTEDSEITYGYCTEFLLRLQRSKVDLDTFDVGVITAYLNSIGNSVVSFRDGSIVKAHVHTLHPGEVLNFCQQFGEFLTLKIENMTLQHEEVIGREEPEKDSLDAVLKAKKHKKYGIVTVAAGEGLVNLFEELGADVVIPGGQSMNPSTEQFVEAFKEISADTILVFPNNSNIVMAASQAAALYEETPVRIVKTKTVGEGYTAISMMDTTVDDPDELCRVLSEAVQGTITGFVSRATRSTVMSGIKMKEGDFIGFSGDVFYAAGDNRKDVFMQLSDGLDEKDFDIMMVIRGAEADPAEHEEICRELKKKYRRMDIIPIDGLQPVYDYIVVLE